jgi:hypothetical protein
MRVDIRWRKLRERRDDERWGSTCVLYAYYSPGEELAYVGKADWCSVAQRSSPSAKRDLWERYVEETGYQQFIAALGELELSEGCRFSSPLLSDIESLLIKELKPLLNRQCITTRISRSGLVVCCQGYWPLSQNWFYDD